MLILWKNKKATLLTTTIYRHLRGLFQKVLALIIFEVVKMVYIVFFNIFSVYIIVYTAESLMVIFKLRCQVGLITD